MLQRSSRGASWTRLAGLLRQQRRECHAGVQATATTGEGGWRRKPRPRGYWASAENRRAFLDEVGRTHGVKELSDWRKVPAARLLEMGGRGLLGRFGNSMTAALLDAYPELRVEQLRSRPRGYWAAREHCRAFLRKVAAAHGVKEPRDWRNVTTADVARMGGSGLLTHFSNSLSRALRETFPEEDLEALECRPSLPRGYWASRATRLDFVARLRRMYGVETAADWQRVTVEAVRAAGGTGFLLHYGSLEAALRDLCPLAGEEGEEIRPRRSLEYWHDVENVRAFLEHARKELEIDSNEEWARVSKRQLIDVGGAMLLRRMDLPDALRLAYPRAEWSGFDGQQHKKSLQRLLCKRLADVFPPMRLGSRVLA